MFRYYLGVAVALLFFIVLSFFLSDHAAPLAAIFGTLACAFIVIGFITSGEKSRW